MYTLENTMLKKTLIGLSLSASLVLMTGCTSDNKAEVIEKVEKHTDEKAASKTVSKRAVDGGSLYEIKDNKYTSYYVNPQEIDTSSFGRTPTKTEIAAWNIDVMPDGTGLPKYDMKHGEVVLENGKPKIAQGSVEWGNELFDAQCAMCHGDFGSGGVGGYPALSGGDINSLTNQLQNPADAVPNEEPPSRKIGSYWPYASTLFWYIKDAMPFPHPKSLTNSETYAIAAYLLMENGVEVNGEEMDESFVMNQELYKTIVMPNVKGFYPTVDTPEDPKKRC
jgi:cytochrome c